VTQPIFQKSEGKREILNGAAGEIENDFYRTFADALAAFFIDADADLIDVEIRGDADGRVAFGIGGNGVAPLALVVLAPMKLGQNEGFCGGGVDLIGNIAKAERGNGLSSCRRRRGRLGLGDEGDPE
jgi:hypothetical protein